MTEILLRRKDNSLYPVDDEGLEYLQRLSQSHILKCNVVKMRNPAFHRKLFALVKVGFDHWEPPEMEYGGLPVVKNFEQFRDDVTIAAGFRTASVNIQGSIVLKAKSWSFGSMEQDEFEKMYEAISTVLLEGILLNYDKDDLDTVVNELLKF